MISVEAAFIAGLVLLSGGVPSAVASGPSGSFPDAPASEVNLNSTIDLMPAPDFFPTVLGRSDGWVCVFHLEGYRLRALVSSDGGQTFPTEVPVAGAPLSPNVRHYEAVLSADGRLYVALVVADPGGDLGLQLASSDDMGQTWTLPQTLVGTGDPEHGLKLSQGYLGFEDLARTIAIDAGSPGVVALAFVSRHDQGYRVTASTDYGVSWTDPIRVDDHGLPIYESAGLDLAIDRSNDAIYVAFSQDVEGPTYLNEIWIAHSVNAGASFDPATSLAPLLGVQDALHPDLAVASDGSVLVALSENSAGVHVARSTDAGQSWAVTLGATIQQPDFYPPFPRVGLGVGSSTVLIAYRTGANELQVHRSTDHGATFGQAQTLASTSGGTVREDIQLAQTSVGTWLIAWNSLHRLFGHQGPAGVYLRSSTDDGATWGTETRIDWNLTFIDYWYPPAVSVATTGADDVVVAVMDDRSDGRTYDLYTTRSPAAVLGPPPVERADQDSTSVGTPVDALATASDGSAWWYALVLTRDASRDRHMHLLSSSDRGLTISSPIEVGPGAPESTSVSRLQIAATADGHVYLVYGTSTVPESGPRIRRIHFNRSTDFGATWLTEEVILASGTANFGSLVLAAVNGGKVYVGWSTVTQTELWLAHSSDGGVSFNIDEIGQGTVPSFNGLAMCAAGSQVVTAWTSENIIVATTSDDYAETFSPITYWVVSLYGDFVTPGLSCSGTGEAVIAWVRSAAGWPEMQTNRYDGATWAQPATAAQAFLHQMSDPRVAYTGMDAQKVAIVYSGTLGGEQGMYTSFSTDGGTSFSSYQRLDDVAPDPTASSSGPTIMADRQGNVWVSWLDRSAGDMPSHVLRRSTDGGMSYGSIARLNRENPQGAFWNGAHEGNNTVLPRAGLFAWTGQRDSILLDALFNTDDLDDVDRDGFTMLDDCDDTDNDTHPGAPEINDGRDNQCPGDFGFGTIDETSGDSGFHNASDKTEYSWPPQQGATAYEVARSDRRDFSSGCVTFTTTQTLWHDSEVPATSVVFHYLNRPVAPFAGSWGQDSQGVVRTNVCP